MDEIWILETKRFWNIYIIHMDKDFRAKNLWIFVCFVLFDATDYKSLLL